MAGVGFFVFAFIEVVMYISERQIIQKGDSDMSVISIEIADEWIRTAQWFGNAKDIIREALKSYSVEQCLKHIRDIAAIAPVK